MGSIPIYHPLERGRPRPHLLFSRAGEYARAPNKNEADRLTIRLMFVELELLLLGSSLIYSSGQARLVTRGGVAMQHALLHGLIDF